MNNNVEVVTAKLYTLWLLLRVEHSSLQVEQDEMVCGIIYRFLCLYSFWMGLDLLCKHLIKSFKKIADPPQV